MIVFDLALNCQGWWKMNDDLDTPVVLDSSPKDNHGEIKHAAGPPASQNWTSNRHLASGNPPYLDGALDMDYDGGAENYIDVGLMGDFGSGIDEITIVAWIDNFTASGGTPAHFYLCGVVDGAMVLAIDINFEESDPLGIIKGILLDDTNAVQFTTDNNTGIADGEPHLIIVIFKKSSGTVQVYVDNVLQDITYQEQGVSTNFSNWVHPFYLGAYGSSGSPDFNSDITLDAFGIFDKALSEAEMTYLWNSGNGTENLVYEKIPVRGILSAQSQLAATLEVM